MATNDKRKILSELSKIEKFNTPRIDGQMISNILRFSFFFGLKKGELINLNVGDVTEKGGSVPETIRICGNEFPVTDEIKKLIQDHYHFLWKKDYKRYRSSPLFPIKDYKRYNGRTLSRHMGKALKNTRLSSLYLEDFRKIGIYQIYSECRSEGTAEGLCWEKAKEFAGLKDNRQLTKDLKDARGVLNRLVDPDKDAYQKYLFSIRRTMESLKYASHHHKDRYIEFIKFLKKEIQDDSVLRESQKVDLFSKIPAGIDL